MTLCCLPGGLPWTSAMSASLSKAQTSAPAAAVAPALVVELLGAADLLQVSGSLHTSAAPPPSAGRERTAFRGWRSRQRCEMSARLSLIVSILGCFVAGLMLLRLAALPRCVRVLLRWLLLGLWMHFCCQLLPAAGLIINQLCCGASRWLPGFPGVFWSKHA